MSFYSPRIIAAEGGGGEKIGGEASSGSLSCRESGREISFFERRQLAKKREGKKGEIRDIAAHPSSFKAMCSSKRKEKRGGKNSSFLLALDKKKKEKTFKKEKVDHLRKSGGGDISLT